MPGAWPPVHTSRRLPWWLALVLLLLVAQTLLVWMTLRFEAGRRQERMDVAAANIATALKHRMVEDGERLGALGRAVADDPNAWKRETHRWR